MTTEPTEPITASTPQRSLRRGFERAGPIATFATVLPILGSLTTVGIGPFVAPWLREQGLAGLLMFTIVFTLLGALALATTYSTSIIAGWTFGFALGFPAVLIGTVAGATLCYLLALRLAGDRIVVLFAEHPKWEIVRCALVGEKPLKTLWIVLLMRLSPVLPFGTTNVLLATTGVPLGLYLGGTLLGLMPRLALIALAAAGAEQLDFKTAESRWMLAGGIVATGACIMVLAVLGKRALDRATQPPQDATA